ncbi:MAG: ATP-binding protein [Proteobacteria bacterium]|nr:ATP-binding protein [Pseudomonadota bacterium]
MGSSAKKLNQLDNHREDPSDLIHFVESLKQQWVETIDALPDPFMIVDHDYRISKANAAVADTAEKEIKSIIGQKCFEVFAGRSTPCTNCNMHSAKLNEKLPAYEIHNEKNDRWYEVVSKGMTHHGSSPESGSKQIKKSAVLQIYRDRTEKMQLQNQLTQQEKLASIGQLAGGFAHEINNPLGGIIVFSQMLMREIDKDSPHFQDVQEIENAAQRCKTIVEGMLSFARQRPLKLKLAPTDLHASIQAASKFAQVGLKGSRKIQFELKMSAKNHIGLNDHNSLMQIILNLCNNAIQAMPKGGTITLSTKNMTRGKNQYLIFTIQDEGSGITKQNLKKIFDPFFTTKEPGKGTGLGLSIVHGLVQDLSGVISCESTFGRGAIFTLEFPVSVESPAMNKSETRPGGNEP